MVVCDAHIVFSVGELGETVIEVYSHDWSSQAMRFLARGRATTADELFMVIDEMLLEIEEEV